MRLLICGSRDWTETAIVRALIRGCFPNGPSQNDRLIEGCCETGADKIGHDYLGDNVGFHMHFPAEWEKCGSECPPGGHARRNARGILYCPGAGPRRNQKMIDEGQPDVVLAFTNDLKKSKGTKDMVQKAKSAGIPTYVITRHC